MQKYKCEHCKGENIFLQEYDFPSGRYRYRVCTTCRNGDDIGVPSYIPNKQVERYLNAKV